MSCKNPAEGLALCPLIAICNQAKLNHDESLVDVSITTADAEAQLAQIVVTDVPEDPFEALVRSARIASLRTELSNIALHAERLSTISSLIGTLDQSVIIADEFCRIQHPRVEDFGDKTLLLCSSDAVPDIIRYTFSQEI